MEVVFEIVCHPCASVTIVDSKEGELRVALEVGEGGAPVLVGLLVALHVGHAHPQPRVGAVVRVLETEGFTLTTSGLTLPGPEGAEQFVPPGLTRSILKQGPNHEL